MVKHLPTMRETWVRSLGWEDPLEKEIATHSSILAWEILCTEKPGEPQSMGSQRVGYSWVTYTHTHTHTEATNMSFNRLMEMQTMRHPDNGRVFNAKKKWAIKHGKTLEEFSMCIAKWKKTIWKATYLDGPNYKTLWKKQKLQSQWKDHWLPAVWGGKDEWVEHRGFLGQENYSVWHYHVGYMLHIHQNP